MRIITFLHEIVENDEGELFVYLLSIYDKSDKENISDNFLVTLIDDIDFDIEEDNVDESKSTDKDLDENK